MSIVQGIRSGIYSGLSGGLNTGAAMPSFQALGTPQGSLTAITVPWPTHAIGDVGFLILRTCGSQTATPLATEGGFVAVASAQDVGSVTAGTHLEVLWARATSTSMTSPVTLDSGNHQEGVIITFRGCVAEGLPYDVTAGSTSTAATAVSIPGATTTGVNRLVMAICTHATDIATAEFTTVANASLSNLTERYNAGTTVGEGGGIMIYTGGLALQGPYSATTATLLTSSTQARMSIAIKGIGAQ